MLRALIAARHADGLGAGALPGCARAAETLPARAKCTALVVSQRMLSVALLATSCAGCVLGPDYVRPTVPVPASYRFAEGATTGSLPAGTLAEMPAWWRRFGDPELDALVTEVT
jgi:hypothetical protein